MPAFSLLLTHPGGAHKDEFLACSVLLATQPVQLVRREPTPADLADPAVCVVDVGHSHDPALNNFDHHQLPADHPPTCALSLVLQHLGLYAEAREFLPWLEAAEWFDARGPFKTAEWLGVEREVLNKLASPIDGTLLRRFAQSTQLNPGEPLWEIMRLIGADLVEYVRTLRTRLALLETSVEFWSLPVAVGQSAAEVLYVPRSTPPLEDPGMGLEHFIERRGKTEAVIGLVYPDRRGDGFGLNRFRDSARLDFTRVAKEPDVRFAHARGFVAKTASTDPARLQQLLGLAFTG